MHHQQNQQYQQQGQQPNTAMDPLALRFGLDQNQMNQGNEIFNLQMQKQQEINTQFQFNQTRQQLLQQQSLMQQQRHQHFQHSEQARMLIQRQQQQQQEQYNQQMLFNSFNALSPGSQQQQYQQHGRIKREPEPIGQTIQIGDILNPLSPGNPGMGILPPGVNQRQHSMDSPQFNTGSPATDFQSLSIGSPGPPGVNQMKMVGGRIEEEKIVNDLLLLKVQPAQFGRFRYKSEQRDKPLEGEQGFPEVQINPKYVSILPPDTKVTVRPVTLTVNELGQPFPHFHELGGLLETTIKQQKSKKKTEEVQFCAQFDNLTVLMSKHPPGGSQAPKRDKNDQRAVRLMFECRFSYNNQIYFGGVVSQPIFNAKLAVNKLSHSSGIVTGGNEVIILSSKVRKGTTTITLSDVVANARKSVDHVDGALVKGDERKWLKDKVSGAYVCVMPVRFLTFHHQYAITFELPPYHNIDITEPVRINMQIADFEDNTESPPVQYTYIPREEVTLDNFESSRKRKMNDNLNEFWSQFNS